VKILNLVLVRSSVILTVLVAAIASPAQTFTKLADLGPTSGEEPLSPLTQGLDGNLCGSTGDFGAFGGGSFIQVTPSGTVTDLYDFCFNNVGNCPDGANPSGQIALGPDGNLYGTTEGNFSEGEGDGSIYKITPAGSETTLYNFREACTTDCSGFPGWGLTLARNGNFYGVSEPPEDSSAFDDLVFSISSSGTFTGILIVCPEETCPTDAGPLAHCCRPLAGTLLDRDRAAPTA
jgi:uncharacterized repeat protein (TIGR03803 family)